MTDILTLIRVVDSETTDREAPFDLVELGWTDVRLFPQGWEIESSGPSAQIVKPNRPISFGAMATHHITESEAALGISQEEAQAIVATSGADFLAAHNWDYDAQVIKTGKPVICTYKCAKSVWPEMDSHSNGAIRYELGLCLGDDRAYPPHRAGPDTWITAHILLEMLKLKTVEQLVKISANPVLLLRIGFGEHAGKRFSEIPGSYLDWILDKSNMPNDPKKTDTVFTARHERARRAEAEASAPARPPTANTPTPSASTTHDPDAWRREMEKF